MSDRFPRKYKITIGKPKRTEIVEQILRPEDVFKSPALIQFVSQGAPSPGMVVDKEVTIPSEAMSFDDLHFKAVFPLKKSSRAAASDTFILEIYNLSDSEINKNLKDSIVVVEAGYESDGELPLVFIGTIINFSTTKSGHDTITKLVCSDGTGAKRGAFASFSFPPKTSYFTMMTTVLETLSNNGLPSAPIRRVDFAGEIRGLQDTVTETGVAYEGNIVEILDSICQEVEFRAYIVHNVVFVEPKHKPLIRKVIEIEPENIIGDIYLNIEGSSALTGQKQVGQGIRFKMFLDGRLDPATKIKINFGQFKGSYLITGLKHQLSYEGNDWTTEVICDGGQI